MARLAELLDGFFYRPDEDVSDLGALVEDTDEPAPAAPEEAPEEFLAFVLEGETYAVPLGAVREIVKVPPLTELPRAQPPLLGVMNLRGEVMPVYDVKLRLRLLERAPLVAGPDAPPPPRAARVVVVATEEGGAGIWVGAVGGVVRLRPRTLEAAPRGLGGAGGERDCIAGIGRRADALVILLDLPGALA